MQETNLELVQRLMAEGKSNKEIHAALLHGSLEPEPAESIREMTDSVTSQPPAPSAATYTPPPTAMVSSASSPTDLPSAAISTNYPPLLTTVADSPKSHLTGLGWPLITIMCLIPVLLLLIDVPLSARFGTLSLTLLSLGDITGVIGLGMYVANLMLATRWRLIETMFGGLNRVFIAHAILGSLALMMLLLHPVLSAFSYYPYGLPTVAHFFVPQLAYIGSAFGIFALMIITVLVFLSLFAKLGYKLWLKTHKYLGFAYLLIALHVVLTPNKITADPVVLIYLWLLILFGGLCYLYRTL